MAQAERDKLPETERTAVHHAVEKLEALGPRLGHPHSTKVQNAYKLRELRPRAGNSPWRCLYRQSGVIFVIAAICPEAENNQREFDRGCKTAAERLAELEE